MSKARLVSEGWRAPYPPLPSCHGRTSRSYFLDGSCWTARSIVAALPFHSPPLFRAVPSFDHRSRGGADGRWVSPASEGPGRGSSGGSGPRPASEGGMCLGGSCAKEASAWGRDRRGALLRPVKSGEEPSPLSASLHLCLSGRREPGRGGGPRHWRRESGRGAGREGRPSARRAEGERGSGRGAGNGPL